jgi:hypothetical protein
VKMSLLVLSHNRPKLLRQALDSAISQTVPFDQILVADSGLLCDADLDCMIDANVMMIPTNETEEDRRNHLMPCWVMNRFIDKLPGDWFAVLPDDDLLMPNYVESFAPVVECDAAPACAYTSQWCVQADANGRILKCLDTRLADAIRGPGEMDCLVDQLQFAFNRSMWIALCLRYAGKPFPEHPRYCKHADGIFMERAVAISPAMPVPGTNCLNRRTPTSKFCSA